MERYEREDGGAPFPFQIRLGLWRAPAFRGNWVETGNNADDTYNRFPSALPASTPLNARISVGRPSPTRPRRYSSCSRTFCAAAYAPTSTGVTSTTVLWPLCMFAASPGFSAVTLGWKC
jgi:hypothetical protein